MMSWMMKLGVALIAFYALVVLAAWLGQRRLMYAPDPKRYSPASVGLPNFEERELVAPDGARIVTWRAKARDGQPTVLYFHGNAGGLYGRAGRAARYASAGYGLMLVSYRGYGGSTGSPSEANNVADARLAYDVLVSEGVRPEDVIVYGESLGSGVAVRLAGERKVGAVVLDAPYTSMVEMASLTYPYLPVRPLLSDRYETIRRIGEVTAPVLVLHGVKDELIPVAMGRAVHAAANEPKRIAIFADGHHTDLDEHGAVDEVRRWLDEIRAPRKVAQ